MDIKASLSELIKKAAIKTFESLNQKDFDEKIDIIPEIFLEEPPDKKFGDYATNFAMQAAKSFKKPPKVIAETLVENLDIPYLEKTVIAGPGFINFYLKPTRLHEELKSILLKDENCAVIERTGKKEKIQVEFVSANPTGPLHVGHGRGAAVGSCLVNLLRAAGYDVEAEFYINDAGNQIDNLAASVEARYLELLGNKDVSFPEDGYMGQDIIETAQRIIDSPKHGDKYLKMSSEERTAIFKELALKEKLAALKEDLEKFGVTFDDWFSERTLHENSSVEKTINILKDAGKIYEKEDALWLKSTLYGDDKDRVVIRDNGVPTYLASDIAYHLNKLDRGFDKLINIWGADHHGYIARVKASIEALGYNPDDLEILILQMVSLFQDGQLIKMSKRTGQGVTLSELIEEVGKDAARFFFIMRSIDSQLDFDLNLAKSRTNENPVYYIQYAHARISSIFRQAGEAGIDIPKDWTEVDFSLLTEEVELNLMKKISEFREEVEMAANERAPHRIARYAHELAALFHSFYNQLRIINAEPAVQKARLGLITAVQIIIRKSSKILGIDAPDRM